MQPNSIRAQRSAHAKLSPVRRVLLLTACGSSLNALRAIFRSALSPLHHADRVERSADNVIAHARQVLHAAPADQHNRVLLQVVTFARNVRRNLDAVRQAHTCNLAESRVRLLRRLRVDARADSTPLRRSLQCGRSRLIPRRRTALPYELTECRQTKLLTSKPFHLPARFGTCSVSHKRAQSRRACEVTKFLLRVCRASIPDENPDGGRAQFENPLYNGLWEIGQLRFAGSGPHSSPRWRMSRAPMRSVPAL